MQQFPISRIAASANRSSSDPPLAGPVPLQGTHVENTSNESRAPVASKKAPPVCITPKEMASIIGTLSSAANVGSWGVFLSFNLQNALTKAARNAFSTKRTWWTRAKIYLSKIAIATIKQLMETLLVPPGHPIWCKPITLYLERDATHTIFQDASYDGMGGWSSDFTFL